MTAVPDPYRLLDPPRMVRVLHDDGRWYTGMCSGWIRQREGGWKASVMYTASPGSQFSRAVDPAHVHLVGG